MGMEMADAFYSEDTDEMYDDEVMFAGNYNFRYYTKLTQYFYDIYLFYFKLHHKKTC